MTGKSELDPFNQYVRQIEADILADLCAKATQAVHDYQESTYVDQDEVQQAFYELVMLYWTEEYMKEAERQG